MPSIHDAKYQAMIKRLELARKACGYTQECVAEKLEKPQRYVSKIENCERRLDVLELKRFLEVYALKSSDIFDD